MTTLILQANSDGITGRCDANCYNAKDDHCTCCCGGANHGKGLQQAVQNTQAMVDKLVEEGKKIPGIQLSF